MASNATEIFNAVVEATVPHGINPFSTLESIIHLVTFPAIPKEFDIQLYCFSGIFGLQLIGYTASVVVRTCRTKDFRLFTLHHTPRGTYINPNFGLTWQLGLIIWLIFLQPYIYMTLRHTRGVDVPDYVAWRYLIWIPAWDAGVLVLWSLCVLNALPRAHEDRRLISSPKFLNYTFIISLAVGQGTILAAGMIMTASFTEMMANFGRLNSVLQIYSNQFNPNMTLEEAQATMNAVIPVGQKAFDYTETFYTPWRAAWFVWTWWTVALNFPLHFATLRHFRDLTKDANNVHQEGGSDNFQVVRKKALRNALRNSHYTIFVNIWTGIFIVGSTAFLGGKPALAVQSAIALQIETLATLYAVAVGNGLGAIVAVLHALQSPESASKGAWNSSSGKSSGGPWSRRTPAGNMGISVTVETIADLQVASSNRDVYQLELRGKGDDREKVEAL